MDHALTKKGPTRRRRRRRDRRRRTRRRRDRRRRTRRRRDRRRRDRRRRTPSPTNTPTNTPTEYPTPYPTEEPTPSPTNSPTDTPTAAPTRAAHGCASWCLYDTRPWGTKCSWNVCYDCTDCGAGTGACKQWCYNDARPWQTKCSYKKACSECHSCQATGQSSNLVEVDHQVVRQAQHEACVHVNQGDTATSTGTFTSDDGSITDHPVTPGETAPQAGTFCPTEAQHEVSKSSASVPDTSLELTTAQEQDALEARAQDNLEGTSIDQALLKKGDRRRRDRRR